VKHRNIDAFRRQREAEAVTRLEELLCDEEFEKSAQAGLAAIASTSSDETGTALVSAVPRLAKHDQSRYSGDECCEVASPAKSCITLAKSGEKGIRRIAPAEGSVSQYE